MASLRPGQPAKFDKVLAREVNRSERSREPVSLVVFDVDHFKAINDSRGHLAGDEVLRAIAEVPSGAVREMDLVARYGGEEFATILPRCEQADAVTVVERINANLKARAADLDGVTVSSGVATSMPVHASDGRALAIRGRGRRGPLRVEAVRAGPVHRGFGPGHGHQGPLGMPCGTG